MQSRGVRVRPIATSHKTVARGERSERVPTLWGLSPVGLHDRFWASFGVAPVRRADSVEVVEGPRLYLLTVADMLLSFPLDTVLEKLDWPMSGVAFVEVKDERKAEYREFAQKDASDRFRGFQRVYGRFDSDLVTVALTPIAIRINRTPSDPREPTTSTSPALSRNRAAFGSSFVVAHVSPSAS